MYNQLAIVLSAREEYPKSIEYLKDAERAYSLASAGEVPAELEAWQRGKRTNLEQNLTQTYFYFA